MNVKTVNITHPQKPRVNSANQDKTRKCVKNDTCIEFGYMIKLSRGCLYKGHPLDF